jgi:putative chitobiose transport system substrate-binding protein
MRHPLFSHLKGILLSVFVVLLTGSFSVMAFANKAPIKPPIQIEFWTMQLSPFHDAYIKGVIAGFEKENPSIRVKWVDVPWAEMEKKTLTAVAAASDKKPPPDVVNLNPQFASKLAEFGALANPEKFLSSTDIASYVPAAWNANKLDGVAFALPWYLTTNVILYNKDIIARAGVSVPTTHESLITTSKKIRAATGGYAYFPAIDGSTPLETLVSMGGAMVSQDGCRAGFIDANGTRILNFYRTLYQDNLVPKNVVTEGHRKSVEMFLSGQIAMVTTGMQFMQFIKNSNPSFYQKIGVAPQLGADDKSAETSAPNIAAMNVAVLQKSANQAAAFAFAQYLTNANNQTEFAKRVPILPSSLASYRDPFFTKKSDDILLNEARDLSVKQVLEGRVLVPPIRKYSKFRSDYARNLQAVMLNRKSVDEALRDMDKSWADILGCQQSQRGR